MKLQLNKHLLLHYLDKKYKMYLPSWEGLRTYLAATRPGCKRCTLGKEAWRRFLAWYPNNVKAMTELKAIAHANEIEFWNSLVHPPQKVVL